MPALDRVPLKSKSTETPRRQKSVASPDLFRWRPLGRSIEFERDAYRDPRGTSGVGVLGAVFWSRAGLHIKRNLVALHLTGSKMTRPSAVMFADIASHGHHSKADEKSARACFLADLREVFEPRMAEHSGRLIKDMGDGLQVEFRNGVDALRCAIDIQRAKALQG